MRITASHRRAQFWCLLTGVVPAVFVVACSREPTSPQPDAVVPAEPEVQVNADITHDEFPAINRVAVELAAEGAFRPGVPIVFRAVGRANLPTAGSRLELIVLDDPNQQGARKPGELARLELGGWKGVLAAKAQAQVARSVTFAAPGYYKVLARAVSRRPPGDPPKALRDTIVLDSTYTSLHVLIEEKGGRLTAGFDPSVASDSSRTLLYGSSGPFIPGQHPSRSEQPAAELNGAVAAAPCCYSGNAYYQNDDLGGAQVPLVNSQVQGACYDPDGVFVGYDVAITDAAGAFSLQCFDDNSGIYIDALTRNTYADVRGRGGAAVSASRWVTPNSAPVTIIVGNRYAAHVFTRLNEYVPLANTRFARSRAQISVWANDIDTAGGINYGLNGEDRIRTHQGRIFDEDGTFVTMHEYGHAFHKVAIEAWQSYSCTGNEHNWTETENIDCAFVEGFADFFSMWLTGNRLITQPYGGDPGLENNYISPGIRTNPPAGGDGMRVEAAFAAFLYDLVDGDTEPDATNNTAGSVESFDNLTVPASWVANVIRVCRLRVYVIYVTKLNGADQMVYCLEKSLSAYTESRRFSSSWRSYNLVSHESALPTYDVAAIRRLWKYNMYGTTQ